MTVLFLILAKPVYMGQEKVCAERGLGNLFCLICLLRSLAIVGKLFLKFLAGEEDAALDCAEREIHLLGDFVVFVAGYVHREGNAVFIRERFDGGADLACAVRVFRRFEARVLRGCRWCRSSWLRGPCGGNC